jgi:hypothetical protein
VVEVLFYLSVPSLYVVVGTWTLVVEMVPFLTVVSFYPILCNIISESCRVDGNLFAVFQCVEPYIFD